MRVKFPVELPKEIIKNNHKYRLQGVYLLKMPPFVYPRKKYIEIIYKNDEWGYKAYFDNGVGQYYFKDLLGITFKEFLHYQAKIIHDHPEFH